jgi:hypothetical protein
MAVFVTGDRYRIWKALSLNRRQLREGAGLSICMADLEMFDVQEGTDLVTEVRALLTQIEAATTNAVAAQASSSDGVQEIQVAGEYVIKYDPDHEGTSTPYATLRGLREQLRRLIDPYNRLLGSGFSRTYAG